VTERLGSRVGESCDHEPAAILVAMHLPASVPELRPARPPPPADREARDVEDWLN
jgi:hypothetical protein